jgi:hypothetical protein
MKYLNKFFNRCKIPLLVLCLSFLTNLGAGEINDAKNKTLMSLKKVDGMPLYYLRYYGDYAFEDYLKVGSRNIRELNDFLVGHHLITANITNWQKEECTCFVARNKSGEVIYGRNFDFRKAPVLLLYTDSSKGYASLSLVELNALKDYRDLNYNIKKPVNLLAVPYFSRDGINEHGVVIAALSMPLTKSEFMPGRTMIGRRQIMRLVLDYAKNVDEAISLFNQFNIKLANFSIGVHWLIADATGKSVVIEYINGKMKVIKDKNPWQVAANTQIYDERSEVHEHSIMDRRYNLVSQALLQKKGVLLEGETLDLLAKVALKHNLWSVVYNLSTKDLYLTLNKQYHNVKRFNLRLVE